MKNKKIIAIIFGILCIGIMGIYTVSPSTINNIMRGDKSFGGIPQELNDKSFGILFKTPEKWNDNENIAVVYNSGSLSYGDKSLGSSVINYVLIGTDENFKLLSIIKMNSEDWKDLNDGVGIGELEFDNGTGNSDKNLSKFYLKDVDFDVRENGDFTYLLVCNKEQNLSSKKYLKDNYVDINELKAKFQVLSNNKDGNS